MIGSALGGLGGNIALLSGAGGDGGRRTLKRIMRAWKEIELADYDFRKVPPPHLEVFAEFFPEVWDAFVPEDVKVASDSPEMRAAQARGIQLLSQVAEEGLPLQDRLSAQEGGRVARQAASRDEARILSDLGSRQALGPGDMIRARLAGAQGRTELDRGLGTDLARMSLDRRLGAMSALPGAAGAVRAQDIDLSRRNAEIINAFNMAVAQMKNQAAASNAAARERAQGYNVSTRQRIGEANRMIPAQWAVSERDAVNRLRAMRFADELARLGGWSNAAGDYADLQERRRAEKREAIKGIASSSGGLLDSAIGGFGGGGFGGGGGGGGYSGGYV